MKKIITLIIVFVLLCSIVGCGSQNENGIEQLEDFVILNSTPVAEFDDVKWGLARKFYKSQSGLLWYEQGYIKKQLPEDIYVRKS